ncbi:MAG: hypothetical protein HY941_00465 [Gammaproteobacteria bacterium]|nr:hypothetical protein [Gammaproteobacteria bacterium]
MRSFVRNILPITIIGTATLISGCAAQLTITSQPEGAYITEVGTGNVFGIAPVVVEYKDALRMQHKNGDGCFIAKGFEARWVSGATTTIDPIKLCYQNSSNNNYALSINRNASDPGLEKDMQFVVQIQTLRAQQEAANAASNAATAAALLTLWAASQPTVSQPTTNQPKINKNVNCTTSLNGNIANTNCY